MVASNPQARPPLFPLGRVVATPGVLEAFERSGERPPDFIGRHMRGDWGDVCAEDGLLNDQAVTDGTRILSAYRLRTGVRIWVITERLVTTLLLPEEY